MSNFIETYKAGKAGRNKGLSTGIDALDRAINGIQRGTSYGLAAAPKCGKTTLADFGWVISPYLEALKKGTLDKIEWIYLSYEIDRVSKEFKYAAYFMYHDFGINTFSYKGKSYMMNQDYLMGRMLYQREDGESEVIPVTDEHESMLKQIYINRIVPMFGEYDADGKQIKKGKIEFIEDPENPTGVRNMLMRKANEEGEFIKTPYTVVDEKGNPVTKERITGYKPNDPDKFVIVVTDHTRKLRRERGFTMKENIDKWLEYTTWLRNICKYTFLTICHSNRGLANVDRLKFAGEYIFPTADDVKDSGNLAEECTILLTLFNPNDEKYNLEKHMDVVLSEYPYYRSIHIAESRYTECPAHVQVNMFGGINLFTPINQM